MRSRKEIMDGSSLGTYSYEQDAAINTKLILEVLLDIRDMVEDINSRR